MKTRHHQTQRSQDQTSSQSPIHTGESVELEPGQLLLNKKAVCHILGGISSRTLHRLEQRGLIKSIPLIRHKLYAVSDVQRLVEEVAQ